MNLKNQTRRMEMLVPHCFSSIFDFIKADMGNLKQKRRSGPPRGNPNGTGKAPSSFELRDFHDGRMSEFNIEQLNRKSRIDLLPIKETDIKILLNRAVGHN